MKDLRKIIMDLGEKFPKKHGNWYRLKMWDDNYLLLDTWSGNLFHHLGCEPHDTNNLYNVVYVFSGFKKVVTKEMENFWIAHVKY